MAETETPTDTAAARISAALKAAVATDDRSAAWRVAEIVSLRAARAISRQRDLRFPYGRSTADDLRWGARCFGGMSDRAIAVSGGPL
jgi:hypothetical protein